MLLDSSASREIHLVFHDDTEYFMSRFVKKGFKHVFAIERQALGWVCIDASRSDLAVSILPARYCDDVMQEFRVRNPSSTILSLDVKMTDKPKYPRLGMMSCVGGMMYLLGTHFPGVLTPFMLYNRLIKNPPTHIKRLKSWQETAEQDAEQKTQRDSQKKRD